MIRKSVHFVWQLAGLAASVALAGCCANNSCNCQDELADALYFRVNYTAHRQRDANGNVSSFNASDIDTIRLYRTNRKPTGRDSVGYVQQTDSVTIGRPLRLLANGDTALVANSDIFLINNAAPFASSGAAKLTGYNYRIGVISNRRNRRTPLTTYRITNPELKGRFDGTGCCTCYYNTEKKYQLTTRLPSGLLEVVNINATATDTATNRVVRLRYAR